MKIKLSLKKIEEVRAMPGNRHGRRARATVIKALRRVIKKVKERHDRSAEVPELSGTGTLSDGPGESPAGVQSMLERPAGEDDKHPE